MSHRIHSCERPYLRQINQDPYLCPKWEIVHCYLHKVTSYQEESRLLRAEPNSQVVQRNHSRGHEPDLRCKLLGYMGSEKSRKNRSEYQPSCYVSHFLTGGVCKFLMELPLFHIFWDIRLLRISTKVGGQAT